MLTPDPYFTEPGGWLVMTSEAAQTRGVPDVQEWANPGELIRLDVYACRFNPMHVRMFGVIHTTWIAANDNERKP